jgi:hypothetical protein
MGVRTAPVAGSGDTPPRTAVVAKSSAEKLMELSNRKFAQKQQDRLFT